MGCLTWDSSDREAERRGKEHQKPGGALHYKCDASPAYLLFALLTSKADMISLF